MGKDFFKKYMQILEYTNMADSYNVSEDGEDEMQGAPDDMSQDMGQGMPQDMGQSAPGDNNMVDPGMNSNNMGAEDMNLDMGGAGVEGFNPEGADNNGALPDMGGQETEIPGAGPMEDGDEVIDVDDLTKSQETAEKKIDRMNAKFDKLMGAVEVLVKQNAERDRAAEEQERRLSAEIEKRLPTPQQRMTMRSTKSAPYSMTPNEYMNNYAPDNYSAESDNNGADDEQYKITKGDIDSFTDYNSIARELDIEHQGLRDILGF